MTSNNWQVVGLSEFAELSGGYAFKSKDYSESGRFILRTLNIEDGGAITHRDSVFIPESLDPQYERFALQDGDTLFVMVGATLGKVGYVRADNLPALLNQNMWRIRADPGISDPTFVYYAFRERVKSTLGWATGSARGFVRRNDYRDMKFLLPPLPAQRAIAATLSAYDELIENNTRRIKILEEMAQAIYREWFVNFRYPGHESVPLIASPVGLIPTGWEYSSLGSVAQNFDRLRRPISKMKRAEMQGDFPYYGAARIFDFVNDYIFDGKYLLLAEDGSVVTQDGYPVLQFVNGKFWANNHTHVLQGTQVSTEYLYLALRDFPILGYVTGSAQPKINQANLNRIPILVPASDVLAYFDRAVVVMLDQVELLARACIALGATRDLLLPRLISGEIEVGGA